MRIDRETVHHIARLAHVDLTDQEVDDFSSELSSIVDHIANLQKIDTGDVSPSAHALQAEGTVRDDVVEPSWPAEMTLANAPRRWDGFFEVQAIFD